MKKSILLVIFLLLSCVKKPVDLGSIDREDFIKKVQVVEESVKSVRGLAYVNIKSPDRGISFHQATVAKEPNLLRLEAIAPFGRTAGMVISDGEKVYVIFPEERAVFDTQDEFDLSYFYPEIPVKIKISNLLNLLLGRLPQDPGYRDSEIKLGAESNYVLLSFAKGGKEKSVLWVNPKAYRIEKARINLNGEVVAECRFEDFKDSGSGVLYPKEMRLLVNGFSISIRFDDSVEVNTKIDGNLFNPNRPVTRFEKGF